MFRSPRRSEWPYGVARRDRFLELARHFGGIPEPQRRPVHRGSFVAEPRTFFLEDADDVGQKLHPPLPLAGDDVGQKLLPHLVRRR
jgi:hypothetical protein